jgi:hypothetical protein
LPLSDDWRPAVLAGDYSQGYVRLDGEREDIFQIRWHAVKRATDLNRRVLSYFSSLERAAKRRKNEFWGEMTDASAAIEFEWRAGPKGYGRLWFDEETRRVFILERSGRSQDSFKRPFREAAAEFETHSGARAPWAILGLSLSLPASFRLRRFKLLSGRSEFEFRTKGCSLRAERWAFAEQLIARHGLQEWAVQVSRMKHVEESNSTRVWLTARKSTALVSWNREENQLTMIRAVHSKGREPQWDFFA